MNWIRLMMLLMTMNFITGCTDFLITRFSFFPQRVDPAAEFPIDPRVEEVFFESLDGTRLHAFWLKNPDAKRVVLFFHGNAGHALYRLDDALNLHGLGANVFLLSYRGYGKSGGRPSEAGVYQDAQAAFAYVRDRLGIPEDQIFVLGRSIGSAVAVDLARGKSLAGLILVTPLASGVDMARYRGIGWALPLIGRPFDSISKVAGLHAPALFIHGDADRIIPLAQGRKLFDAYPAEKAFKLVPGGGHNDIIQAAGSRFWDWIGAFLDAVRP